MTTVKSAYGDKVGTSAHTGFFRGSGIQSHSVGGYFPLIVSTRENYDTGIGCKYVWDGRDSTVLAEYFYTIGRAGQTGRACRAAVTKAQALFDSGYAD